MAKAGDGARRSGNRRLTAMISLRLDPDEKHRFGQMAMAAGYPSLAAWILDRLRDDGGVSLRHRRTLVGHLGRIGADLAAHAHRERTLRPDERCDQFLALTARIAALQRDIMKGGDHAGEENSEPTLQPRRPG